MASLWLLIAVVLSSLAPSPFLEIFSKEYNNNNNNSNISSNNINNDNKKKQKVQINIFKPPSLSQPPI